MENLHSKIFKKEFVNAFKGDHSGNPGTRQTPGVLYSKAIPTPVNNPALLAWSEDLAKELELNNPDEKDVAILGGNLVSATMYPYAACYAGHQFGNWAGQLGDGRAITLGEIKTSAGKSWELQLKGAGPTPYSRRADGRAVLRSSVREYLMSEAMFYLGVPTTRALGLVTTGDQVLRDMFYNGNAAYEPGAIVMRVSPSFLRFGNFEMLAARQETDNLKHLVDWTIQNFYPHIHGDNKIIQWYKEVVDRTAALMVEWLRVGFVHGVMNTDNMSILGLTIDYGPYSFLDDYDLSFTPNTTDLPGRRYALGNQSSIAYWNLSCLASAIAPLFQDTKELVSALETFEDVFYKKYFSIMGNKLGFDLLKNEDTDLLARIEEMLSSIQPDMTIFYQLLTDLPFTIESEQEILAHFQDAFYKDLSKEESKLFYTVIQAYKERINKNQCTREDSLERMRKANPRFILRNYLLHQAIEELEKGQNDLFLKLQKAMKDPYSKNFDEFFVKRPNWATQKAGCSMLSCSS